MRLVDRDYKILREVYRWKFCLGRHISVLCDFTGSRACDRRLKMLIDAGYLERKKIMYGVPSLYYLTRLGRILLSVPYYKEKDNINNIIHNVKMLDCLCALKKKYNLSVNNIESEKEMHSIDGFANRKHKPDFVITHNNEKIAIEIELSLKAKKRFEKNVSENYLNYDKQLWIIHKRETRIIRLLENWKSVYNNLSIAFIEDIIK